MSGREERKGARKVWVPVFEHEGREYILPWEELEGDNPLEAMEAWAGCLVALMILNVGTPVCYREIDPEGIPHVRAVLNVGGGWMREEILVLSGEEFEEARSAGAKGG